MNATVVGVLKYWRPTIGQDLRNLVRTSVTSSLRRPLLNAAYATLSPSRAARFHERFWDIFRERLVLSLSKDGLGKAGGSWKVTFCGRPIWVPLRRESLALDWGIATALLGHDVEIKQTYAALIQSSEPPALFIDVGSNFGTHSVLWLSHGIRTISLDPNATCNEYHRALCAANGLVPRIETVAIGDAAGSIELSYPPDEPWLGSTDPAVGQRLKAERAVETRRVEQRTVDHYLPEIGDGRVVVKIDTEGNEHRVLAGAAETLRQKRPLVFFECWSGYQRRELHQLLQALGYGVATLPWNDGQSTPTLDLAAFLDHPSSNFIAVPVDGDRTAAAR